MPTPDQQRILDVAAQRQGIRYKMPPPAPDGSQGLDCSLFVDLTFRDAGFGFPGSVRTAEQLRQASQQVGRSEMQTGDLLFFENTYNAAGPAGPDGKIATHVGIAIDGTGTQMWDCHASNDNTDLPGVGITAINQYYWEPKLFDVRRAPGLAGSAGDDSMARIPLADATGPRFRVTTNGLRLRAAPDTSAAILISDLGNGSTVTAIDDQVVDQGGNQWRHIRAANGTVGWASANFLEQIDGGQAAPPPPPPQPKQFRVTTDALRLRDQPSLSSNTLATLPQGAVVMEVDDSKPNADGIEWHHVRANDGTEGWMSRQYLERVR